MEDENASKPNQRKYVSGLSKFMFKLPSTRKTVIISLFLSVIVGIIGYIPLQGLSPLKNVFIYGSVMGIFFIWLPLVVSALLTTLISTQTPRELILKRSVYLSFFCSGIISTFYLIGSFVPQSSSVNLVNLLVYGYVIILIIRALAIKMTSPYTNVEVFGLSLIHPLSGYFFIFTSPYLTSFVVPITLQMSIYSLLLKTVLSSAILMAGVLLFFAVLNAPMKRNFGVSTFKLSRAILSYWIDKSTEVEHLFTQMGENTDTQAPSFLFRSEETGYLKSIFVVPYLHPGPFEGIGGGKLTEVFTDEIEGSLGVPVFLPHSSSTHDLNPADIESVHSAARQIENHLKVNLNNLNYSREGTKSITVKEKDAHIMGQVLGDTALTVSSFSPKETDDIDTSLGLAIENVLKTGFREGVHVDAHNCYDPNHTPITSGDTRAYDLMESSEKMKNELKKLEKGALKQGISVSTEHGLGSGEIGHAGIRVNIFEVDGQKTCYIVVDSNNVKRGFREKVIEEIKKLGMDQVELLTTDTHSVNKIDSGETPLGTNEDHSKVIKEIKKTVKEALDNLESVEVAMTRSKIKDVNVLGKQTEPELISTVNATVATIKIIGPVIFGASIILSLLAVVVPF